MRKISIFMLVLIFGFGLTATAKATLIDMGDGTIYDTDRQLSWLQDANYAKTSGADAVGWMTWSAAVSWADTLDYAGFTDWRLPTVVDTGTAGCNFGYSGTDCGFNVDTGSSEMAHLFYDELGNEAYYDTTGVGPQPGWGLTNTGDFTNLLDAWYWSGTGAWGIAYGDYAWYFNFFSGNQTAAPKYDTNFALAVRPGQRSTSVPEPATLLLLGSGLAGVAAWRRRLERDQR